ncbi:urea ABC transporter permease subunit UrtC [Paenibacillus lautus]|jgi:urea transport system permease protein|uniref:Urea ABC transporter permease subunit UrtC n=1 Tax=Paenibacillus lautus TaxID=1401 RepID=A0A385TPU9_PAELA|nr:urea ABC transporter permease subunit UrtC [Paenibacillus lautus]AYB45706.1 urea ABC transporter permease subunit UrtC [Paenibacillus lautus]MCI1777061.1 urea ABC transporter permease subunit UrtC [Paenibacillus lautus]
MVLKWLTGNPGGRSKRILWSAVLLLMCMAPLFTTPFRLGLLTKFLALAILAVGLDLIWGYGGILSLGHGVFFGLGAYAMAMYLKLDASGSALPDFMGWSGVASLPWFWEPFRSFPAALILGMLLPALLALILGFFTFRNRIVGVYFTILTQALVMIVVTLFVGKQEWTGGTNGLTGYSSILGFNLNAPSTKIGLYFITLSALAGAYILCRRIVNSRVGQVLEASRDGENRVRFLGFDPSRYKTFAFAVSGGLAGLAGMLFVLQVGIISPSMMGIVPSIEMVLWVALGGRGTLIGAIIGAVLLNAAKTGISEAYPEGWLLVLGALFVIVVVLMPKGLTGLWSKAVSSLSKRGGTVHAAVRKES